MLSVLNPATPAHARARMTSTHRRVLTIRHRRARTIDCHHISRLKSLHRQQTYRVPGHRHISISTAAVLLQPTASLGSLFDFLCRDPAMCGRIYSRFCEEARCTVRDDGCRAAATKIAHRCFMSDAAGLTFFKGIVQDMAAAGDHRAFCWFATHCLELKRVATDPLAHPRAPSRLPSRPLPAPAPRPLQGAEGINTSWTVVLVLPRSLPSDRD